MALVISPEIVLNRRTAVETGQTHKTNECDLTVNEPSVQIAKKRIDSEKRINILQHIHVLVRNVNA